MEKGKFLPLDFGFHAFAYVCTDVDINSLGYIPRKVSICLFFLSRLLIFSLLFRMRLCDVRFLKRNDFFFIGGLER